MTTLCGRFDGLTVIFTNYFRGTRSQEIINLRRVLGNPLMFALLARERKAIAGQAVFVVVVLCINSVRRIAPEHLIIFVNPYFFASALGAFGNLHDGFH